jgi:hypothetical protein
MPTSEDDARTRPPGRRLLTVTDTFLIAKRGLILAPDVDLGEPWRQTLSVELRRPDGTSLRTTARAEVPLDARPRDGRRIGHMLTLQLPKDAVPLGTEVWLIPA